MEPNANEQVSREHHEVALIAADAARQVAVEIHSGDAAAAAKEVVAAYREALKSLSAGRA